MARETKVGMLVGLGFIICFAIILENRGRGDRVGPQMPHESPTRALGGGEEATPTVAERRARDYGRAKGRVAATRTDRPSQQDVGSPSKPRVPSREQQGTRQAAAPSHAEAQPRPAQADRAEVARRGLPNRFAERRPAETVEPAKPTAAAQRPINTLVADTDATATLNAAPPAHDVKSTPTRQRAAPEPPTPEDRRETSPLRRYRVKKGDTLSRIAAEWYGSRSNKVVEAIFNANRAVLSNPDAINVDQEIRLPVIEGVAPAPADKQATPTAKPERPPPKQEQQYRYYQIKKGDRYVNIAQEQLGSTARWKEIAELNADIFPDPAKIRHGVRIRLPADSKGQSQGQRS
ncbi:MAG: LysM peptidoglycan-binding domain-containing protein [Planctomycetota bacterium]|jgi:nucleoid-associated protein YgaU